MSMQRAAVGRRWARVWAIAVTALAVLSVGAVSPATAEEAPDQPVGFIFNPNYDPVPAFDVVSGNLKFPMLFGFTSPEQVHTPEVNLVNQGWRLLCSLSQEVGPDGLLRDNPNWGSGAYCSSAPGSEIEISVSGMPGVETKTYAGQISITGGCLDSPLGCEVSDNVNPTVTITRTTEHKLVSCYKTRDVFADGPCPYVPVSQTITMTFRPRSSEVPGPEASFTFDRSAADADEVQFTDRSSHPRGLPLLYAWDFGDGETSIAANPKHTYASPGSYTVTLTVTDTNGKTSTYSQRLGIVVNSVGDSAATNPSVTGCDTGSTVGDRPECTLRAAIETVNATSDTAITFDIPGDDVPVIALAGELPDVEGSTRIDGMTQPSGSVTLDGGGDLSRGLSLTGGTSVVTGLSINGFSGAVDIDGGVGHRVEGNRFGVEGEKPLWGVISSDATGVVLKDNVTRCFICFAVLSGSGTTIEGNSVSVDGDGSLLEASQVGVLSSGTVTVSDNVFNTDYAAVVVTRAGAAGSVVDSNLVGVRRDGSGFAVDGEGIRIDGTPGVVVSNNVIAASRWGGVLVSGSPQVDFSLDAGKIDLELRAPYDEVDGASTGGGTVVTGNTIGVLADGATRSENRADTGVAVWAGASNVRVEENTIANTAADPRTGADIGRAVSFDGGSGHRVVGNMLGTSSGQVDLRVGFGVVLEGTSDVDVGVIANGNTIWAERGVRLVGSNANTSVDSNFLGLDGVYAVSVGIETVSLGASEPTATGLEVRRNTIQPTQMGVQLRGTAVAPVIADNVIFSTGEFSRGKGMLLGSDVTGAKIERNTIFGTGLAIDSEGRAATITGNVIGLDTTGAVNGVDSGIWVKGDSTVEDNTVAGTKGTALIVTDGAIGQLTANSVYETVAAKPISVTRWSGGPTISGAIRSGRDGSDRTMLIIGGLPADETGTVEVFANNSCDDGEARHVLGITATKKDGWSYVIVPVVGLANRDHFTATYTNSTQGTSELSNCESRDTYPDSDGDGSPDPLEELAGSESNPRAAGVDTHTGELIRLDTTNGELRGVGIVDDPAPGEHPGGFTLPHGVMEFQVTGLEEGATAKVRFVRLDSEEPIAGDAYWKYGATPDVAGSSWYQFDMDEATGTGAAQTTATLADGTVAQAWELTLIDGARGDNDGVENGVISDPGGPGIADTTGPTTPTTAPQGPAPTNPAATPDPTAAPPSAAGTTQNQTGSTTDGTIVRTGSDLNGLALLGILAVAAGTLAVLAGQRRKHHLRQN